MHTYTNKNIGVLLDGIRLIDMAVLPETWVFENAPPPLSELQPFL
jgi:hypothetical protein